MSPYVARIRLYPVKSLGPFDVPQARVLANGALAGDRRWVFRDSHGAVVNAKRFGVLPLRLRVDPESGVWVLPQGAETFSGHLPDDADHLCRLAGDACGLPVTLAENLDGGFPDDTEATGPTVVSTATLEAVASWFPGITVESVRARFRANVEIGGAPAFWEDRLFGAEGRTVRFQVGAVTFEGTNPCQRCVVPSLDPETGDRWPGFQAEFARRRAELLPVWADRTRFNHFYRLATNTRGTQTGTIAAGDAVTVD